MRLKIHRPKKNARKSGIKYVEYQPRNEGSAGMCVSFTDKKIKSQLEENKNMTVRHKISAIRLKHTGCGSH